MFSQNRVLDCLIVQRKPDDPARGLLRAGGRTLKCALGRTGPGAFKREGDGHTPAQALMRPLWGFWRADKVAKPQSLVPFAPIGDTDGWCDASGNANYNAPVRLPFAFSHEVMKRSDDLYDIGLVLDWNMLEIGRAQGRGSAIFMHLARPGYKPTEGCIALSRTDMVWLLKHISLRTGIMVTR